MAQERSPALTGLLALLPPGGTLPDVEELEIVGLVAVEHDLVDPDGGVEALNGIISAAKGASLAFEGRDLTCAAVEYRMAEIAFDAFVAVSSGYEGSKFERCLGPVPDEVGKRIACARERPALSRILLRSAGDHLASAVMDLVSRLPGARDEMRTDGPAVTWRCAAESEEALEKPMGWLSMPGPGALARRRFIDYEEAPPDFPHWDREIAPDRFALILDPDDVSALGGPRRWASVSFIENEAEHGFYDDFEEAARATLGLPLVSLHRGRRQAAIVPFSLEVEAISIIADAAVQSDVAAEPGPIDEESRPFAPLMPPSYGGLAISVNQYGLDLAIGTRTAEALGWAVGDRIAIGRSDHGGELVLRRWNEGPALVEGVDGLETAHTLPLPLEMVPVVVPFRIEPPYLIDRGYMVVSTSSLRVPLPRPISEGNPELPSLRTPRPIAVSRRRMLISALAGAAAGVVSTLVALSLR